jgi:protein-S-isoprenylcysteine O-methyltransferase Ste14
MKEFFRHLSSFIAPILMGLVVPFLIIWYGHQSSADPVFTRSIALLILGLVIGVAGFVLFILAVRLFILIGNGTIMPWDPTRKLIVVGLYRYVRNPMILSVLLIQIGEALVFASRGIAWLAVIFFVVNTLYFTFSEEPGLEKRFGAEYIEYKKNVPMWLPRLTPWQPG